jgi:predicted AlkP superfamily phosphohydrolase/phosphomutase
MRVLLLGIDALDRDLLETFAPHLPHFTALRTHHTCLPVHSTFPPDSDTAWATIITGLNPAEHGIVHFVDPLAKSYHIMNVGSRNDTLRGRTFWDRLGQAGYQAHAIFPHLGYPLWSTPGMMIARSPVSDAVDAAPPEILDAYPDPQALAGVRGFPQRTVTGMQTYARRLTAQTRADATFALRLMHHNTWDLFFVYFSTLDAISHFFWSTAEIVAGDSAKGHPRATVLLDTYRLYDDLVGQCLAAVDEDVTVLILSDHGHGARPSTLINVNEILRRAGFLKMRNMTQQPYLHAVEAAKRFAVRTVSRYGWGRAAGSVMRHVPGVVQTFARPAAIDWENSVAFTTDMSGIKAYAYGGIVINRKALKGRSYRRVRAAIIDSVREASVAPDGSSLLTLIAPRESLYQGPFLDKYPDIVLEFCYGYGVGWSVNQPLIEHAASHNLVPGSHRGDTGVFLMRGTTRLPTGELVDLEDIAPMLIELVAHPRSL